MRLPLLPVRNNSIQNLCGAVHALFQCRLRLATSMDNFSLSRSGSCLWLGYVMNIIAFQHVPDSSGIRGLNWRFNVDAWERESCCQRRIETRVNQVSRAYRLVSLLSSLLFRFMAAPRYMMVHDEGPLSEGVRVSASSPPHRPPGCQAARDLYCTSC